MNTVTETTPATVANRATVGLLDLVWLTWRQHRAALISTTVGVLALGGWVLWTCHTIATPVQDPDGSGRTTPNFGAISAGYDQIYLAAVFAGIIAVFWAAPLLAREYEQRTHLLAWSQDVTRRRWLVGKVLTLGGVAVLLAALVGVLADHLTDVIDTYRPTGINFYGRFIFEAYPALQVAYVLFGFSLGLLFSAVFRRVLPATAVTLVAYVVVRVIVATFRFDHIAPIREISPFTGIAGQYQDFQPGDRLVGFRLIEVGIFVVLAAVCGVLTWLWMRRSETT